MDELEILNEHLPYEEGLFRQLSRSALERASPEALLVALADYAMGRMDEWEAMSRNSPELAHARSACDIAERLVHGEPELQQAVADSFYRPFLQALQEYDGTPWRDVVGPGGWRLAREMGLADEPGPAGTEPEGADQHSTRPLHLGRLGAELASLPDFLLEHGQEEIERSDVQSLLSALAAYARQSIVDDEPYSGAAEALKVGERLLAHSDSTRDNATAFFYKPLFEGLADFPPHGWTYLLRSAGRALAEQHGIRVPSTADYLEQAARTLLEAQIIEAAPDSWPGSWHELSELIQQHTRVVSYAERCIRGEGDYGRLLETFARAAELPLTDVSSTGEFDRNRELAISFTAAGETQKVVVKRREEDPSVVEEQFHELVSELNERLGSGQFFRLDDGNRPRDYRAAYLPRPVIRSLNRCLRGFWVERSGGWRRIEEDPEAIAQEVADD